MSESATDQTFHKVDAFLKAALTERDLAARAKLLGKAVYWNEMLAKAQGLPYRSRTRLAGSPATGHPPMTQS